MLATYVKSKIKIKFFIVCRSQAYNARAIQVGNIPNGVVNQPVEFESMYRKIYMMIIKWKILK